MMTTGKINARTGSLLNSQAGFTLIELIMVMVMIGILGSVAIQKFIDASEDAEVTAEATNIDMLRANMVNTMGERLVKGQQAAFPTNPFDNLTKVPQGYNRFRTTPPTGEKIDDDIWVFVRGSQGRSGAQITPQQSGTTLPTFRVDGFIYHQRRDSTVVRWAYDSSTGVISKPLEVRPSDLKRERDVNAAQRGDSTIEQNQQKTR